MTYKVISTKKLDPHLIARAREKGIEVVEQEFISVHPLLTPEKYAEVHAWVAKEQGSQVVFTSANAVEAVQHYLHRADTYYVPAWRIFCLAGKTMEAVLQHFNPEAIMATANTARALAGTIIGHGVQEVVFFCGNRRRDELPRLLQEHGIGVHEITVYETRDIPAPALADPDAILFFSPSAVGSFFSVNSIGPKTVCFAIGSTTAAAIADYTDNKIITPELDRHSQDMIMASVEFYFQNINCYE